MTRAVLMTWLALLPAAAGLARAADPQTPAYTLPRGLQDMELEVPEDNPISPARIALGEKLFFDTRLSKTKAMSCETCHVPEKGWTDGLAFSPKFDGSLNTRHTPTLYGAAFYPDLYWDGRSPGLEAQILAAWKGQMGADPAAVAAELAAIPGYRTEFQQAMGGPPDPTRVVQALATFVRTLHAADTPWDGLPQDEDELVKTEAGRGFKVFAQVARCTLCHVPPVFSDTLFHNLGIGFDTPAPDLGRGKFLADAAAKAGRPAPPQAEELKGAFKTPSLRGVALTAPYFHDGRAKTLDEAVDLVLKGGIKNPHLDAKLQPYTLTAGQRRELMAFLNALTPAQKPYARPKLP